MKLVFDTKPKTINITVKPTPTQVDRLLVMAYQLRDLANCLETIAKKGYTQHRARKLWQATAATGTVCKDTPNRILAPFKTRIEDKESDKLCDILANLEYFRAKWSDPEIYKDGGYCPNVEVIHGQEDILKPWYVDWTARTL